MKSTDMFKLAKIDTTMKAISFAQECGLEILFSPKYRRSTLEKLFARVLGMELTDEDMKMLLSVIPFFNELY
nr:MAG TPA: hypothetical protein [Bacteriophage sp.]